MVKGKDKTEKSNPQVFMKDISPVFSNSTEITHGDDEFTFTFMHVFLKQTNTPQGQVKASVTVTPKHAKRILNALQENIKGYEQKFGEIKLPEKKEEKPQFYRA